MAWLPPELVVLILSKLCVKSLCRFKSISKSCWTLITHPQFAKLHLAQTQRQKLLLIGELLSSIDLQTTLDGKLVLDKFPYPTEEKPDSDWISVYNSSNGLFCLSHKRGAYILYNPSTRESKKLPNSQPTYSQEMLSGFGYAESIDDYKFVKVVNKKHVHVFSLTDNSWKIVPVDFPSTCSVRNVTSIIGIPLKGAIHWTINTVDGKMVIAAFDLVEENFRLLSLPDSIALSPPSWVSLRVVGDCLCIFYRENEARAFWIMKEYGVTDSWISILRADISPYTLYAPLCLWKNEGMITVASNRINWEWAICYQRDGESCKDLGVQDIRPNGVHAYMESLVSVDYNSNLTTDHQWMDDYLLNYLPNVVE